MLVKQISKKLRDRQWRLSVAESATGGLLGHLITQVPGSSDYFWGGVIAYANDVKREVLGVSEETLERWGAVSARAALEMAQGTCRVTGAEVGISITGIAGPTGATAYKPIGLYYIGLAVPSESWCWRHHFDGNRRENNEAAAEAALEHLLSYLR
jgi:PncC family amidohydrolase